MPASCGGAPDEPEDYFKDNDQSLTMHGRRVSQVQRMQRREYMAQEDSKRTSQSYDLQSKEQRHGRLVLNDRNDRRAMIMRNPREGEQLLIQKHKKAKQKRQEKILNL